MQLLHFFPLKLWLLIKDCCTCTSIHMHCISVNSLVTSRWLTSIQALSASRTCSRPYLHVYTVYMYIKTSWFNAASSREKDPVMFIIIGQCLQVNSCYSKYQRSCPQQTPKWNEIYSWFWFWNNPCGRTLWAE